MKWLDEYAYKAEEKLDADSVLAERVYRRLAQRLIESGTGAVSLFGTIKEETKSVVSFHCGRVFDNALVLNPDRPLFPV
jgi:guanine deaminase